MTLRPQIDPIAMPPGPLPGHGDGVLPVPGFGGAGWLGRGQAFDWLTMGRWPGLPLLVLGLYWLGLPQRSIVALPVQPS